MTGPTRIVLILALLALPARAARADNIGWRGDGSGKPANVTPPADWSAPKNILWSADVPKAYSSPIVVADKVFCTAEPDLLVCLDRATGKTLWKKSNGFDQLPAALRDKDQQLQTSCGYATPTPTSDGRHVFAAFGTGIVAAYDLTGQRLWITFLEHPGMSPYGRAASPLLIGDKLIVPMGHYTALDPATGKVAWDQEDADAGFGSPVLMTLDTTPVILTATGCALDPATGKVLTSALPTLHYTSPVVDKDVAYFIDATSTAVRLSKKPDGKLQVKELWEQELEGEFFASPVVHAGLVYACNSTAQYTVLDAATGEKVLTKTLELPPAGAAATDAASIYPSLVLADDKLFLSSTSGDCYILRPGKEYKELARTTAGEDLRAAPVFIGKQALLRTADKLLCAGK